MDHQRGEQASGLTRIQQVIALIGVLLIAASEYLIIVQPADSQKNFPPFSWLFIPGIILIALSLLIKRDANFGAKFKFTKTSFEVSVAVILSLLTLLASALFSKYGRNSYLSVTFMWLASGLVFILAFSDLSTVKINFVKWFRKYKYEVILVCTALIIGGILRFYQLGLQPRIIDGDEGLIGLAAQSTNQNPLANPFALWENFGALYLQLINFFIKMTGASSFAIRVLPAISGTLAIPALFLFARQVAGSRIAIIAAFLLAFSNSHIHFSRIGSVAYIHSTWLVPLELYLLLWGLEKRSSWRTAAAGVLLAIDMRVYLTAQIIIALILIYMLVSLATLKNWFLPAMRQVAAFWGGLIIMLVPQVYYIYYHPDEFLNRLSSDGTFQSGWLEATIQNTGQSAFTILLGRVIHAFLSLIYYPAVDFYGSSGPLLSVFSAIFFIIGIVVISLRLRSPGFLLLNGYFWAATVAIGVFALPPSADSYRMLLAFPAAFLIAAIGFDYLLSVLGIEWTSNKFTYALSTTAVLIAMMIIGTWSYFINFAGECKYGGGTVARFASYLGAYTKTVSADSEVTLLSDGLYFYGSHASTDYLSNHRKIINYSDPVSTFEIQPGSTLIANPARINELLDWITVHPGGRTTTIFDCSNPILVAYQLPDPNFGP